MKSALFYNNYKNSSLVSLKSCFIILFKRPARIGSGIMLFTGLYKKYVVLVPAFIMLVIVFTTAFGNYQSMIQHLALGSVYILVGYISYK